MLDVHPTCDVYLESDRLVHEEEAIEDEARYRRLLASAHARRTPINQVSTTQTMPEETVTLPREQAAAIFDYLATKPFGEVNAACQWLAVALESPASEAVETPEEGAE